jgi:HEAT repeat protein/CRP-like cAMP-binding protein
MNAAQKHEPQTNQAVSQSFAGKEADVLLVKPLPAAEKTPPETICDLLTEKNSRQVDLLLEQLAAGLHSDNPGVRLRSACYLTDTLELLIAHQEWQRFDKLLPAAEQAAAVAAENDIGIWQLITVLSAFAAYQIEMGKYASARKALLIFAASDALANATEKVRSQAEQLMRDMATRPLMELLLVEYLYDQGKGYDAGRLLTVFGRTAARFLLEAKNLKQAEEKTDALLWLFEEIGRPAEESLCQLLRQSSDWYLIRNIIRLLGEKGSPACFETVTQYLAHDDLRVKGEVLRAASRIDAPGKKDFFLKALQTAPRQLIELVVTLIGDIPDSSLVAPLADLLDEAMLVKNKASQNLQIAICLALGKMGSVKALPTLKKFIAASSGSGPTEKQLLKAAEQAMQLVSHGGKHRRSAASAAADVPQHDNPYAAREAGIIRISMVGDRDVAARQLYELIAECVQTGDFQHAERLRERFSEINPNAIAEIIQSAELIEQARSGVQSRGYLEVWSNLLHELTSEEFSAIYHELENRTLEPEEILVSQGDKNDELFFINYGTIRVFYKKNDRRIYIKSLSDGDLAGENFFDTSVWTVSMSALTESRISILRRSCFARWQEAFPGLERKLRDFYGRSNNIRDLLQRKGLNRRSFERYTLSRKIEFRIVTDGPTNAAGQRFKGKLADVSRGGLAMHFRMAQPKDARVLLGRRMHVTIPVAAAPPELDVLGQVLSIRPVELESGEHRLHLEFDEPLGKELLQTVLG